MEEINFEEMKDAALGALEDANAKEELLDLLEKNKDVLIGEGKGYLRAIVAVFTSEQYDPEKYAEFVEALDDEQLTAEVNATADELDGLVVSYGKKKKFIEDLTETVSFVVRKALVAALSVYTGPAAGPIGAMLGL